VYFVLVVVAVVWGISIWHEIAVTAY